MSDEPPLVRKRAAVGLFCLLCLAGAAILTRFPGHEALQGALVRVGVLLGAFWLVLKRPPKWKRISSNWVIAGSVLLAVVFPRARAAIPLLAVLVAIALFARPRK